VKLSLMTLLLAACPLTVRAQAPLPAENPLFQPSTLPYQLPPFDKIKEAHFIPRFRGRHGRAAQRS
jgi:peptidyl-dipeptidase Dcp